jgi:formylglycine-generating enzyme required for sulfatase activity/Leucine-rich repeat (LRR) protein
MVATSNNFESKGRLSVYSIPDGKELVAHALPVIGYVGPFLDNDRLLFWTDNVGNISFIDTTTWKTTLSFKGHDTLIRGSAVSPDGTLLSTLDDTGILKFWDLRGDGQPAAPPLAKIPFDAAQTTAHQEAWAKHLGVKVETPNRVGGTMVLIPPGDTVPKPYFLGKYEVTQEGWQRVMGYNPSAFKGMNPKVQGLATTKFPVEQVSWFDSAEYCNKLSEMEGFKPYYDLKVTKRTSDGKQIETAEVKIAGGNGYHLPTGAEWDHACRAGATTKYYFGDKDEDLPDYAWFDKNSDARPHTVGEKKANAFGLHDMHGNVWEWIEEMQENPATKPPARTNVGGGWNLTAGQCAIGSRFHIPPATRNNPIGFRLARSAAIESTPSAKRTFKSNEWIDVLEMIDPVADKVTGGKWAKSNGALLNDKHDAMSKILFPIRYLEPRLEWEFSFTRTAGDESGMTTDLPHPDGFVPLFIGWHDGSGIYLGQFGDRSTNLAKDFRIVTNTRYKIRVRLTRDGPDDRVEVFVDDKSVGQWKGNFAKANKAAKPKNEKTATAERNGLNIAMNQEYTFHTIRVRMLDGATAESIRPVPSISKAWETPEFQQWMKDVAAMPAEEQIKVVSKKLMELNPGYDGKINAKQIQNGIVTEFHLNVDKIEDISPVRAFAKLTGLWCEGSPGGKGRLSDLSPLQGMKLNSLTISENQVSDLSPIRGMPLVYLGCSSAKVTDLSPLEGMKIGDLRFIPGNISKGMDFIRGMKSITIFQVLGSTNSALMPPAEFWKKYDAGEFGKPITDFNSPAFHKWMKDVAAMPAEEQIKEVSKKMVELNPGFDGKLSAFKNDKVSPTIENGMVTGMEFSTAFVSDVSPLRALQNLQYLNCWGGAKIEGVLTDLAPLQGLPLKKLHLSSNPKLADLSPLRDMKLTQLHLTYTNVTDLSPLKAMPLDQLMCGSSPLADLSPLEGMKLTEFSCAATKVADLSPLRGMPLKDLACFRTQVTDLSPLKGMPLTNLNICDTKVSDITPLEDCKNLYNLWLKGSKITAPGVAALQKVLPKCKIDLDDPAIAEKPAPKK